MLRGIETNRIIVGAYVDSSSGGICPMLAAHRNGARTSVANFARAWDTYTCAKRPRRATRREVRTLRSLLEWSLDIDSDLSRGSLAEAAAQIRAEREQFRCATTAPHATARRHRRAPPRARAPALPRLGVDAPHQAPRRVQGPPRRRRGAALRAASRRDPLGPRARPPLARAGSASQVPSAEPSPGRRNTISGTRHARDVFSKNRTDSAMSSGRIIASASTWPFTKSVIGVSTNPGQSAVT